jgi:asparagine synthase (glutamine-hydrolysing)
MALTVDKAGQSLGTDIALTDPDGVLEQLGVLNGGAIDNDGGRVFLTNCTFLANSAIGGRGGNGGHGVTGALNGDGGDESFAGYTRYAANLAATRLGGLPEWLRRLPAHVAAPLARTGWSRARQAHRLLERLADPPERRYAAWMLHFDLDKKRSLCTPAFLQSVRPDVVDGMAEQFHASSAPDLLDRMLDVDVQTYLLDDLLVKVDIATMAHSLEARSPLLDHRVMELAASLPSQYKLKGRIKKHILKRVAAPLLPAEMLTRPKMGFGVPIERWFRHELFTMARDVLLDSRAVARGYFRPDAIQRMLDEHRRGIRVWHYQIWNLLMLELWHQEFIDRRPRPRPGA